MCMTLLRWQQCCSPDFPPDTHGQALCMCRESYDMDAVYVHDPAALAAVLRPSLFAWRPGQIRVLTESVARGMSVMDTGLKRWNKPHAWTDRPKVQVAVAVNAKAVTEMLLQRMAA